MYKLKTLVYKRDAANVDLQAGRDSTALKLEISGVRAQEAISGSMYECTDCVLNTQKLGFIYMGLFFHMTR